MLILAVVRMQGLALAIWLTTEPAMSDFAKNLILSQCQMTHVHQSYIFSKRIWKFYFPISIITISGGHPNIRYHYQWLGKVQ